MLRGDLYLADDPMLIEERARAQRLLEQINATGIDLLTTRHALLAELLGSFGEGAEILPPSAAITAPRRVSAPERSSTMARSSWTRGMSGSARTSRSAQTPSC
jgi:hypothetical protein